MGLAVRSKELSKLAMGACKGPCCSLPDFSDELLEIGEFLDIENQPFKFSRIQATYEKGILVTARPSATSRSTICTRRCDPMALKVVEMKRSSMDGREHPLRELSLLALFIISAFAIVSSIKFMLGAAGQFN